MKKAFAIIGVLGFVYALGTAGASDMYVINERQLISRVILSLVMVVGGFLGVAVCEYIEEHRVKKPEITIKISIQDKLSEKLYKLFPEDYMKINKL